MDVLVPKRFWLLQRFAKVLGAAAWVVLGLAVVITPVAAVLALWHGSTRDFVEVLGYGGLGGLVFVCLLWIARSVEVILAIEENTRHAGFVLEQLTTLTQQIRDRSGERPVEGPIGRRSQDVG